MAPLICKCCGSPIEPVMGPTAQFCFRCRTWRPDWLRAYREREDEHKKQAWLDEVLPVGSTAKNQVRPGRPPGITESFVDKADFDQAVGNAIRKLRGYPSIDRVAQKLDMDARQLRRSARYFGYIHWKVVLSSLQ